MIDRYLEKVYSGFLGMNIGIRLGAPVEPTIWTYERIHKTYGEITNYVKEYKNFAADDDANGPVFFLRALYDDAKDRELIPQDVARAWLNYSREGVGMFWWGGYGISTEHTAYLNLKNGIPAPASGSIAQNGKILAEQIGGQIFIDTWGLVNPNNPKKAADYGEAAASVSHDGDGIWGARFFCAAISKAFSTSDINAIIACGLSEIPTDSNYYKVAQAVLDFHKKHPEDWRACREMLEAEWGYDRYHGVCHMIPNAGVCIMSLIYGDGDFAQTIEIATMAGWDTDCNAGNVGTVLGVACNISAIPAKYREPINDSIVCSSIAGSLNIIDIPSYAKEVSLLGYRLADELPPKALADSFREGEIFFDFELSGSTHNMRISNPFFCTASYSEEVAYSGKGSLKVLMDRLVRGDQCKVFYKPFYTREDFSDERYSPVFSPTVYSGQTVSMKIYLDQWEGLETAGVAPYIRTCSDKIEHLQGYIKLIQHQWIDVSFVIPDTDGDQIDEVGIVLEGYSSFKKRTLGAIYLDNFEIKGSSSYHIAIQKQKKNFASITPFSMDHGAWDLYDGTLNLMRNEPAFAYTGNYFSKDYAVLSFVTAHNGESHLLTVRAQGAQRGYLAGLGNYGKAVIIKNDFGYQTLAECDFIWNFGQTYQIEIICLGNSISLLIDGKEILSVQDSAYSYGMFGCGSISTGRTSFGDFYLSEYKSEVPSR